MTLHRVRPGYYLHFPPTVDNGENALMGAPGAIFDTGDAFTAKCVEGQEYKLEPAPEGAVADAITHSRFRFMRDEFNTKAKAASASAAEAAAATPEAPTDPSIPKPDPRPKKEEKKHGTLASSLSQSDSR